MARDPLTSEELLAYSAEHVAYEINMLRATVQRLTSPTLDGVERNALIEACGVHLRVLTDFLYDDGRWADDVAAADFFDNPAEWKRVRPPMSESLRDAYDRASKELVHLTTNRKGPADATKAWPFPALVGELLDVLRTFIRHASAAKLHSNVRVALNP